MAIDKKAKAKDRNSRNVAGYTLKDQIRKTVIRNELKIFSVSNRIQNNNRLNWIHHFGRMEPERIPKHLMDYTPCNRSPFLCFYFGCLLGASGPRSTRDGYPG
jgi:hypothetical protein